MIETTSRGSFNHDQMKHIQNGRWIRRRGKWPKDPKLGYYEANFLVKIWADEEVSYQRWKETIYGKTSPQISITMVTSILHPNAKPKFTTWNKSTKKQKIQTKPAKNERNCDLTVISSSILHLTFEKFMQV